MNKLLLDRVKDKFYEAEGLLELLQLRTDKAPELAPMILTRIDEARELMASLAAEIEAPATAKTPEAPEDPQVVAEPAPTYGKEPKQNSNPAPEEPDETQHAAPAFCLNDRFRFRRTIFGGSEADFNAAVAHLAELNDPDKAEKYLVVEAGLDPDDPDVADFLEIVRKTYAK